MISDGVMYLPICSEVIVASKLRPEGVSDEAASDLCKGQIVKKPLFARELAPYTRNIARRSLSIVAQGEGATIKLTKAYGRALNRPIS